MISHATCHRKIFIFGGKFCDQTLFHHFLSVVELLGLSLSLIFLSSSSARRYPELTVYIPFRWNFQYLQSFPYCGKILMFRISSASCTRKSLLTSASLHVPFSVMYWATVCSWILHEEGSELAQLPNQPLNPTLICFPSTHASLE